MKIKVITIFNDNFVLSKRNDESLPAECLERVIERKYGKKCKFLEKSLTGLKFTVECGLTPEILAAEIGDIIAGMYELESPPFTNADANDSYICTSDGSFLICALDCMASFKSAEKLLSEINSMVGWDSFKQLCTEIAAVAPEIIKHDTYRAFCFQNYLFSVNDGCGLSTALRLFSELVSGLGLFEFSEKPYCFELCLSAKGSDGKHTPADALKALGENNSHKLVCFDIGEYMERSRHNDFKRFLARLVELETDYIFAFRIPFVEPDTLHDIEKLLSDVLFVRSVPVVPFTNCQLKECAERALAENDFRADENVWNVFFSRICEEKSDGKFYGVHSVNKIVCEMLWLKHRADAAKTEPPLDDKLILRSEILALSPNCDSELLTGFDELDRMVGMRQIADRLREIVAQVKLAQSSKKMEYPCLHMRFVGAPGTGKTSVARIVGQIFAENGILRNGFFFEYTARDLCGEFVGQTAPKTSSICRDAYGSVLFIDEAYALYADPRNDNDYGREALTTLVSEMESHRNDMVVIMAGYKDDMDMLMQGNAGLRSRMPFLLEFPSYTREQLLEIFMLMAKRRFSCDDSLEPAAKEFFYSLDTSYIESKEFANARFVRNLYERTWSKAAVRSSMSDSTEVVLSAEDFRTATSDREFSEKLARKTPLGFN